MALSLCQMPLAVQETEEPVLAAEAVSQEETVPVEETAPTEEVVTVLPEAAVETAAQQASTLADEGESIGPVFGELGTNLAWRLDTASGALSIYGTGPMYDFNLGDSPLQDYRSDIKTVTIGGNVTSVGAYLFYQCTNLTVAVLGSSVAEIGKQAFCGCSSLSEVNIPYGVTSIGEYAFSGCKALTEIVLPGSVTSIGNGAFSSCSALTEIEIPSSVTEIGSNAFFSCRNLNTFITRGAVASVGYAAFDECPKLKNVKVSSLDAWLQLTFEDAAANPARNARTIYVGDELLTDTDVVIPDTVTSINPYAFNNFTHFTSVYIPKSVKTIGKYAFSVSDCVNTTVKYAGSEEEWKQISIADNNRLLTGSAPIYYNQSPEKSCRITTAESEHGTVTVDNALVNAGDTVTITAIPAPGYAVASYLVDGVEIPDGGNTFTATKDHEVSATFIYDVADDGKACGTLGENITWTLDTVGVLHIDGDGAIDDCDHDEDYCTLDDSPLYPYRESIESVIFSGRITHIGDNLFSRCSKLRDVVIPDSVVTIGVYAFSGCPLTEVVIPDSVETIGDLAFAWCKELVKLTIGSGVTSIGGSAFLFCDAMEEVVIPDSVTTIGSAAFTECSSLKKVTISNLDAWLRVTFGSSDANPLCYAHALYVGEELLTDLVVPGTVTSIRPNAFYGCTSITSVYIPQSVKTIGGSAFSGVSGLNTVYYAGSQKEWSQISIDSGNEPLTSLTPIYDQPLEGYCRITAVASEHGTVAADNTLVKAGDTVTITAFPALGYAVAAYLVDGVEIPDGGNTFTVTKDHVISATFTKVYDVADDGRACGTLGANITWALDTEGVLHIDGVGEMDNYLKDDEFYGEYNAYIVPFHLYRGGIKSVDFSGRITHIGNNLFYDCEKLTEIVIPDSVTSIGDSAFSGCTALTKVVIPDGVTSIGEFAFYVCKALTEVMIPDSVISIGRRAFDSCTALTEVVIPGSVTSVGDLAFWGCTALTKAVISDGVTSIGASMFYGCTALAEVVIPSSVTSIGNSAFSKCTALTKVVIQDGVTSIGNSAFYDCTALAEVVISDGVTSIGDTAFYACNALTKVVIPASVTSIGGGAFECCNELSSAEFLGNAPEFFGTDVFYKVFESPFMIFYHSGTTGWTSPTWNGYAAACIDPVITSFSTLDDSNRNAQHVLFLLNDTAMTATVGANTIGSNNAGYDGGYNGEIVIPDTVIKGESTYKVIGINQYAFADYPWVNTVTVGKNVSAIEPSAFRGCKNLTAITVDEENLQFADQDGVLFDKAGLYLYVYPAGHPVDAYTVPDTCDTVGTQAFYGAVNLTELTVPNSVKSIGASAFAQCYSLQEIVLPFFGGSAQSTSGISYVFRAADWGDMIPATLKRITVYGTNLSVSAFFACAGLEKIYLPDCGSLTVIPEECFSGCTSLKTLAFGTASSENGMVTIPNTVTEIGAYAFSGCSSIRGVTLGRDVSSLGGSAFSGCTGIEKFVVANGNTSFMADQWGVLYSADKTTLYYYPSARTWPYYNVSEATTSIGAGAFSSCKSLVNLFIPRAAVSFGGSCIFGCPSVTICCYKGSAAARYAISNGLTSWFMDNYELQGLNIISLPEQLVFNTQGTLTSVPYLTASYGDKTLQLDDYQVVFEKAYGAQTVAFASGGCSVSAQATVVRQGDINGDSTTESGSIVNEGDLQCLYEYLATDTNTGSLDDQAYFEQVCDFNGDGRIDVLDYQALYTTIKENAERNR